MQPAVLTRKTAKALVDKAVAYAVTHDFPVVIAVVDDAGHLIVLERINGAQPGAIDVAIRKAETAAVFRRRTRTLEDAVAGGRTALLSLGNMMPVEGGLPIVCGGYVIGAVGVSGVASTDDEKIALAAFSESELLSYAPPTPRIFPEESV